MSKQIILDLDDSDYEHVRRAIEARQTIPMPPGGGNPDGQAVAEICRGWGEWLGFFKLDRDSGSFRWEYKEREQHD